MTKFLTCRNSALALAALGTLLLTGCNCCDKPAAKTADATKTAKAERPAAPTTRIRVGSPQPYTDSNGNKWEGDTGFADGETIERADELEIKNTKDPGLYRRERYLMTKFSREVPNGKYTVKLHFCETFEGITDKGQRVFSFNVEGHEFKDFDVWAKAGGFATVYIETVEVEVKDGKLDITFTPNIENPEINGIEIIPRS